VINISILSKAVVAVSILASLLILSCEQQAQEQQMVTIPEGTSVTVSLQETIGTEANSSGDRFETKTIEPITVEGNIVVPAGTTVRGTLTEVDEPESESEDAEMTLAFNTIVMPDGEEYSFETHDVTLRTESDTRGDVEKIAAGALAGAVIGAIAKGDEGAAVGAVVGAAAGGAVVIATQENRITLKPGQKFLIQTTQPVKLPAPQAD